jgi:integrase
VLQFIVTIPSLLQSLKDSKIHMATIEKRTTADGKTSFRIKVRLKGYPVQTATFERITDAKKWIQDTESSIREGRHFKTNEAKKHTTTELIERYIKEILPRKPKSMVDQTIQLNWWKENIGAYLLSSVTPAIITEYRGKLLTEPSKRGKIKRTNSTANRYCAALSHCFTIAVKEWEWMQENPIMKIAKLKEPKGRVRYLSDEERERLLKTCKESQSQFLYLLVVLAISTGARKMEICKLTWNDIDLNRSMITLHDTKNKERRSLPLVGSARDLMKLHYKNRNENTNLAFPAKNLINPIDIRTPFETALKKAEIEDFTWHDLRHSCASYLAMNGATLAEIAAVLGHKTLSMVKRYSHISDAHTSGVVERMNNKIFGERQ